MSMSETALLYQIIHLLFQDLYLFLWTEQENKQLNQKCVSVSK